MAIKSIIDMEINDAKFKDFSAVFDKYAKALEKTPAQWGKVSEGVKEGHRAVATLTAALLAQNEVFGKIGESQKKQVTEVRTLDRVWTGVSRSTKQVAVNLKDATISLIKWASVTSVVGGLLGAGGLFGLDRLANNVGGTRRNALGLGATYGGAQSFGVNFGRLVEPGQFMSSVAEAKFDVQKRVGLYGAGLSEGEINSPTEQTSAALLTRLKQIADNTNPAMYGQIIQARQLGQFTSPQDLERLHNTSPSEFRQLLQGFNKDTGAFGIQDQVTKKWQDFATQMTHAGQSIENVFVTQLSGLVPGLTKLSTAFEDVVKSLLGGKGFKELLDDMGKGLETFATYLGTDEFQKDVKQFASGVAGLAGIIGRFVKQFGGGSDTASFDERFKGDTSDPAAPAGAGHDTFNNMWVNSRKMRAANVASWHLGEEPGPSGRLSQAVLSDYIKRRFAQHNIDPNVALTVAQHEGLGRFSGDNGTSFGAFQLHVTPGGRGGAVGDAFKKYTGLDPSDPRNEKATIDFAADWVGKYGWKDWMGAKAAGINGFTGVGNQNTNVNVWNNTGGSAIVTSAGSSGAGAAVPSSVN